VPFDQADTVAQAGGGHFAGKRADRVVSPLAARRRSAITLYSPLMSPSASGFGAHFFLQLLISGFFGILFLQSGIDKVIDRRGNLDWLTGHFAKSPLGGMVPLLLGLITLLELAAGVLSAVGCVLVAVRHDPAIGFYGVVVSGFALLALFFGQRMAKDYPGAGTLVPYFLVVIAGLIWLGQS
jgi:hypothetical protein